MFLRTDFKQGDPVRKVANAQNLVRVANILEGLQVIGGHLVRNYNAEGLGWLLVIDGASDGYQPSDSLGIVTSDRLYAVDSLSRGRLGRFNHTGFDSTGYVAARDIHVHHDVCADTAWSLKPYRQIRSYIPVSDTTTPVHEVLSRTSGDKLVWAAPGKVMVDSADTMAYLGAQFADTAAYDSASDVTIKAVVTAGKAMRLMLKVGSTITAPTYLLALDSLGTVRKVEVTDTCDT